MRLLFQIITIAVTLGISAAHAQGRIRTNEPNALVRMKFDISNELVPLLVQLKSTQSRVPEWNIKLVRLVCERDNQQGADYDTCQAGDGNNPITNTRSFQRTDTLTGLAATRIIDMLTQPVANIIEAPSVDFVKITLDKKTDIVDRFVITELDCYLFPEKRTNKGNRVPAHYRCWINPFKGE